MAEKYLTILEVSQKQAYIFESNKMKDNIINSAVIARCLSPEYIKETLKQSDIKYNETDNLVYSGGGHTVLEFSDEDTAKRSVWEITKRIYKDFDGLMVFAKTIPYDQNKSAKDNLKDLTAALEKKKAIRESAFRHGSFGVEKIDVNTLKPQKTLTETGAQEENQKEDQKEEIRETEYNYTIKKFTPEGYQAAYRFEDLGGEKGSSNFIAVVHIDGNGMGKRVDGLYKHMEKHRIKDWKDIKTKLREFSDCIDMDFKAAFKEMTEEVKNSLESGKLKGCLKLKKEGNAYCFPIRRIITAGDDICFVTEGRIGIECARIYIEKLKKKINKADGEGYSACAGVAIVHQKYPFFRAYELAEELCSNAKKAGAELSPDDNGSNVCSIDWHVEFGEVRSKEEIREDYIADDGSVLTQRPYVLGANVDVIIPEVKLYSSFAEKLQELIGCEKEYGDGKVKMLRNVMKQGKAETENYVKFYQLGYKIGANYRRLDMDSANQERDLIAEGLFDAIEIMDTFFFV